MTSIKYIYTKSGLQEAIIVPIEFWNDLFLRFNLKTYLEKENYFNSKYSEILENMKVPETYENERNDFYSLFGSWQSEKTGDEINEEIYSSRKSITNNYEN